MALSKAKALQEAEKLVAQGKIPLAIKQYLEIIENEPSDLILLNTVGDLCVREKNIPEALQYFNQLADSYMREGFTVKAIAIYKKISKLHQGSIEPVLKLAELYMTQGLSREAREQYTQALDYYRKRKQNDKIVGILRKIVQVDPENPAYRARLAEFCEQAGQKAEAAQVYLEAAHVALRQGDSAAVEHALKKATDLDPKNPQIRLLKARVALATQRPGEVEKILSSVPGLQDEPAGRELLLEAYLATKNVKKAEEIVLEVYRVKPAEFAPLASYAALCADMGDLDAALRPLVEVADGLIEQRNTGPLTDVLRHLWSKDLHHLPTLELLRRVCEQTGDELTLPEVLEALGHAYVEGGTLEKAETAFHKLVERDPGNANYQQLLKQVLQKLGKEFVPPSPAALVDVEMALTPEVETAANAGESELAADANEAAAVKEALENSDLFSRYGLIDKAVAELEKALEVYPDQLDIHERILEVSQRNNPRRAGVAAAALARILSQRGDPTNARRYEEMARAQGVGVEYQKTAQFDLRAGIAGKEAPGAATPPEPPAAPEFSLAQAEVPVPESPAEQAPDLDLSEDLAAFSAPVEGGTAEPKVAPFNYDEARVEIDFYFEQGFAEEAQKTVEGYEQKHPGNPEVASLREQFEGRLAAARAAASAPPAAAPATPPPAPAATRVEAETAAGPSAGAGMLGNLASDLASSLEGIEAVAPPSARAPSPPSGSRGTSGKSAGPLSGLLEELGEPTEAQGAQDDPETHYSLGVAFREMGLLDEAIGEFQKVLKSMQKGKFPPHFLQACTLLASSFMEKKMPAIAAKWYLRALEMPELDEDATLALLYDLGVAYEQSGETRTALEKFTEVYTQNIDYRDVAEKIRLLQQKV